mmetsp:Transcript_8728/g.28768  ORF Transcript_8728/g.28768 Transcript_8728/m.28768 type:complete len:220 (-) Transcript_8728:1565-2224(-)
MYRHGPRRLEGNLQPVADAAPHHLGAEQRRKEDLAPPIVEVDARNQQRPIPAATASAHVFTCSPIRPNPSCQVGLVLLVIMHPPEKNIARALVALRQLQRGLRLELVELGQPGLERRRHLSRFGHGGNHAERAITELVLGLCVKVEIHEEDDARSFAQLHAPLCKAVAVEGTLVLPQKPLARALWLAGAALIELHPIIGNPLGRGGARHHRLQLTRIAF